MVNGSGERNGSLTELEVGKGYEDFLNSRKVHYVESTLQYPAVAWTHYIDYGQFAVKAVLRTGVPVNWTGLDRSEEAGAQTLRTKIRSLQAGCPGRSIAISGYSQGADVVGRVLLDMTPAQKVHMDVALLGNPSFDGKTTWNGLPDKQKGIRLSAHVQGFNLVDRKATSSGGYFDTCSSADAICSFSASNAVELLHNSAHYFYGYDGDSPKGKVGDESPATADGTRMAACVYYRVAHVGPSCDKG
jgi:hypothetical protein